MNHSSSNYSRPGWRIKTDIYIFFISFSFFLMIFWILWLCIKQPNLVALQQLTLPDDILVWKMHQRLTVEGKKSSSSPVQRLRFRFQHHIQQSFNQTRHIRQSHSITIPHFFLLYLSCLIFFAPACEGWQQPCRRVDASRQVAERRARALIMSKHN